MNQTQFERYKKLVAYLNQHFKEEINIAKVEAICHYSYRNINRIFQALHHETIGKYIKRIRLEKAAEYLKYSQRSVSDIAFEVGFSDIAAFSKAFKNRFNCAPSAFRNSIEIRKEITRQSIYADEQVNRSKLQFEIEYLPAFEMLYLEYRGLYDNFKEIEKSWELLFDYSFKKNLLKDDSIFFAEMLDDNDISDQLNCRYNVSLVLKQNTDFQPDGLFHKKTHPRQKYAKFIHQGSNESCIDTYEKIYAYWMLDIDMELADLPVLEFFPNHEEKGIAPEDLITEIYIPVH
jgi:AraC family transcriptional regulator